MGGTGLIARQEPQQFQLRSGLFEPRGSAILCALPNRKWRLPRDTVLVVSPVSVPRGSSAIPGPLALRRRHRISATRLTGVTANDRQRADARSAPNRRVPARSPTRDNTMNLHLSIGPLVSLIAGILILIMPRLLNYIVAIYLIVIGLIGLFGTGAMHL